MDLPFFFLLLSVIGLLKAQAPIIQNKGGAENLKEKQNLDTCVYQLTTLPQAVDCNQDAPVNTKFSLQKRSGDPDFCVYFLASQLPLDASKYTIHFTCDDGGAVNTDSSYVNIAIIQNLPPTFTEGAAVLKFVNAATTSNGATLFTAAATDPDADDLTYSLDATYPNFAINPANGQVLATVDFNTLSTPSFTFQVQVTDSYHANEIQNVTLILNNLYKPPTVTNVPTPFLEHPEDVSPGLELYKCTHEESSPVTITLDVVPITEQSVFDFNAGTCEISVKAGQKLDYERLSTMNMTLNLDDGVDPKSFTFTFNVKDANDPPSFDSPTYTMDINEGPLPVTPAIQPAFAITDEDAVENHTYSLGTGTYESYFTIDQSTGALTNIKELDFDEGIKQVTITVVVTDKGLETSTTSLTVNIADYNDNDPVFDPPPVMYISTQTTGSIGLVTATDKDEGDNAKLTYDIVSDTSGGKFQIDPVSGSIIPGTPVTEADRGKIYFVGVRATDGGTPARSGETVVLVLFNPPPTLHNLPNIVYISVDTTNKVDVFRINATDDGSFLCAADSVAPSPDFVVEQKSGGPDWYVFYNGINPLSPGITPYTVEITCTDNDNGKSIKGTLTINVIQNQPPSVDCAQTLYGVDASTADVGTLVTTISATDVDTLSYEMTLSQGPGTFTIDPTNGEIKCQKLMIRETISQYQGVVKVKDNFNTATCTITFTMTNTNEAPVFNNIPKPTVDEDVPAGSSITDIILTDQQNCGSYTFTMDVEPVADQDKFTASITDKVITLSLANGQELDHESVDEYVFHFRGNDGCLESNSFPMYLSVRDVNEKPEFAGTAFSVTFPEHSAAAVDSNCGGLDPDVWDTHQLELSGTYSELFQIANPSKCTIRPLVELDRDAGFPERFTLNLKLTDKAGLSATAIVNVIVQETNDNAPLCNPAAFTFPDIYNGDQIGRQLGRVVATDQDLAGSVNSQMTFRLISPSTGTNVIACANDGTFTLIADPGTQLSGPYALLSFTVEVTDKGTPPLSSTCKADVQYIYTTTTTPPPTLPPTQPQTIATTAAVETSTPAVVATLSPIDEALSNPVILALIAVLGALAALAAIIGIVLCCWRCGPCKGSSTGSYNTSNPSKGNYDYRNNGPSRLQSRNSNFRQDSPKGNQVGTTPNKQDTAVDNDIFYGSSEVEPEVSDAPTTLKYVKVR